MVLGIGILVGGSLFMACEELGDLGRGISKQPKAGADAGASDTAAPGPTTGDAAATEPPPAREGGVPDAPGPATEQPRDGGVPDAGPETEAMCRHYCETLEATVVFSCLSSGRGTPTTCVETAAGHAELCFDVRCGTGLVDTSLCLRQCDSLALFYEAGCATADSEPLCPLSPPAHDAACRIGCTPAPTSLP